MARSAYPYSGWVPDAIHRFKYGEESSRASDLVERMTWTLAQMGEFDLIVPVPLHERRLRERGYNQSALLAEGLAQATGIAVRPLVERTRVTSPQAKLGREDRLANVQGAFRLNPKLAPEEGKRILLVDDVRTTSATLNACASVLVPLLPQRICVATFAIDLTESHLQDWLREYAT
jgi:ComF family protein